MGILNIEIPEVFNCFDAIRFVWVVEETQEVLEAWAKLVLCKGSSLEPDHENEEAFAY